MCKGKWTKVLCSNLQRHRLSEAVSCSENCIVQIQCQAVQSSDGNKSLLWGKMSVIAQNTIFESKDGL